MGALNTSSAAGQIEIVDTWPAGDRRRLDAPRVLQDPGPGSRPALAQCGIFIGPGHRAAVYQIDHNNGASSRPTVRALAYDDQQRAFVTNLAQAGVARVPPGRSAGRDHSGVQRIARTAGERRRHPYGGFQGRPQRRAPPPYTVIRIGIRQPEADWASSARCRRASAMRPGTVSGHPQLDGFTTPDGRWFASLPLRQLSNGNR